MALVEPLIQRINQETSQDALNDELASKLTEETVAALSPSTKIWLVTWARQADKPMILEQLQKGTVDKSALPAETLLNDLFELSEHLELDEEMARLEMKATTASLRHYIRRMKQRRHSMARAETMDQINGVQDTLHLLRGLMQGQEALSYAEAVNGVYDLQDTVLDMKEEIRADATKNMSRIQDAIKLAVKEEMENFQQSIQKGVTKRTHEEAFSNQDSN